MAIFKCKMCGGDLEILENATVCECEFCGTKQTVPTAKTEALANLFNRANKLRIKCEFDKAEEIYEKILGKDETLAEAHWGLVLCKYGIEYVEDPATETRVPTCHRTSYEAVTSDADYLSAVEYADSEQKKIYKAEAKVIEGIQKRTLEIVKNEKPFDVFICYKETDKKGKRTVDSTYANDIYHQLTNEGFKVFYAAITLEDKLGQEYEPYIFAALNSAKVMLVIGSKEEYFNAIWVKNEWSRFLKLMKTDRSKLLIPCYKDIDPYDLPEEFAHLQAQDMAKIGFVQDLLRGIKKVVKEEKKETTTTFIQNTNDSVTPLLKRAFMFLEDGEFENANQYAEKVLDIDPECALGYVALLMVELEVEKREELGNCKNPFNKSANFQKAVRFGDEELANELNGYIKAINARNVEAYYNQVVSAIPNATKKEDFEKIITALEKIKEYKDTKEKIELCESKIEEILNAEEEAKKEAERQAEIARKEAEKRAKRNKKVAAVVASVICVIIAFVILLNTVIIPNGKYNDSIKLMESGNVIEAYEGLVALDGYKDSKEKANSIYDKYKVEKLKIAKAGDYVFFGTYEQDNNLSNGTEAIEWIILEVKDGKALVISKRALDCKQYNTSYTNVTWETCTLRNWLNNEFINAAFSADEKAMIPTVTVSADKNPEYSTNPGKATQDKVFLLSITEANKYFSSDSARQCKPTAYAVANGAYENSSGNCWWWLRSPGYDQIDAAGVLNDGVVDFYVNIVSYDDTAVRPALWIVLNS